MEADASTSGLAKRAMDAGVVLPAAIGCNTAVEPFPIVCPEIASSGDSLRAPRQLRIATWNIKTGSVRGLEAIVSTLERIDADIVLLQEIDVDVARSGNVDQVRMLAEALGHRFVFAPTVELEGGLYGIALLSRLPFRFARAIALTNKGAAERRTAIEAHLWIGARVLRVINHHADYIREGAEISVVELLSAMASDTQLPTLFAGDFNQEPTDRGVAACVQAGLIDVFAQNSPGATFGARRIDYVLADETAAAWVYDAEVIASDASDHSALVVNLELLADQQPAGTN